MAVLLRISVLLSLFNYHFDAKYAVPEGDIKKISFSYCV